MRRISVDHRLNNVIYTRQLKAALNVDSHLGGRSIVERALNMSWLCISGVWLLQFTLDMASTKGRVRVLVRRLDYLRARLLRSVENYRF